MCALSLSPAATACGSGAHAGAVGDWIAPVQASWGARMLGRRPKRRRRRPHPSRTAPTCGPTRPCRHTAPASPHLLPAARRQRDPRVWQVRVRDVVHVALGLGVPHQEDAPGQHAEVARRGAPAARRRVVAARGCLKRRAAACGGTRLLAAVRRTADRPAEQAGRPARQAAAAHAPAHAAFA